MEKNVWVFFGSRSAEHDVSITSAFVVMKWLKEAWYNIFPIYINNLWKWIYNNDFSDIKKIKNFDASWIEISLKLWEVDNKMHLEQARKWIFSITKHIELDIAFHVLHWLAWEDGSIQGLCELVWIPYIWPGILWGSTTLDKIITKDIFVSNNLPIVPYVHFEKGTANLSEIESKLNYPMFVKPFNLGSSIWVSKVGNTDELKNAIEVAEHYSNEIIVEEGVNNLIELNCAVCEKDWEVITTLVEQPTTNANFLSFEEKYISTDSWAWTMSWNENKVHIPALIPENVAKDIQNMSKKIFKIFKLWGAPRIDYLYDEKNDKLYVNEINPIPGAMQMHLWDKSGLSQVEFMHTLINSAITQNARRNVNTEFKSNILDHTISFMK